MYALDKQENIVYARGFDIAKGPARYRIRLQSRKFWLGDEQDTTSWVVLLLRRGQLLNLVGNAASFFFS